MDIFPSFLNLNNKNKFNCLTSNPKYDLISDVKSIFFKRRFRENEIIYKSTDNFKNLYYVDHGCIKTFKTSCSGVESISGFQMAGEWAGLESVGCTSYNNYSQVLIQSDVYVINYQALQKFLITSFEALRKFNKLLSYEILRNIKLLNILRNSKRETKVILFFLELASKSSLVANDEIILDLHMSRGDISSYLSISREEISRILQKLQNSGLIHVKNRQIHLLDMTRLTLLSSVS
jgi:CRP/FNR family transcriptional regulator